MVAKNGATRTGPRAILGDDAAPSDPLLAAIEAAISREPQEAVVPAARPAWFDGSEAAWAYVRAELDSFPRLQALRENLRKLEQGWRADELRAGRLGADAAGVRPDGSVARAPEPSIPPGLMQAARAILNHRFIGRVETHVRVRLEQAAVGYGDQSTVRHLLEVARATCSLAEGEVRDRQATEATQPLVRVLPGASRYFRPGGTEYQDGATVAMTAEQLEGWSDLARRLNDGRKRRGQREIQFFEVLRPPVRAATSGRRRLPDALPDTTAAPGGPPGPGTA